MFRKTYSSTTLVLVKINIKTIVKNFAAIIIHIKKIYNSNNFEKNSSIRHTFFLI